MSSKYFQSYGRRELYSKYFRRQFVVRVAHWFRRSCGRGRCVGFVFSLFSVFVVVVAWVPFLVRSVVVYRFRCSFVFVGVSLFRCFFAVWSCPQYRHTFVFPYMPCSIPHGEGHLLLWFQPIEAPVTMFGTGFVKCMLFISAVCLCLPGNIFRNCISARRLGGINSETAGPTTHGPYGAHGPLGPHGHNSHHGTLGPHGHWLMLAPLASMFWLIRFNMI